MKIEDLKDVGYDETKYGFIYLTTNNINGKMYIGQRKYDKKKKYKYYLGSGILLTRAIKKYGRENFSKIILCNTRDRKESNEKEKYYISLFDATNSDKFYNIAKGGDGGYALYGYTEQQKREHYERLSKILKDNINKGSKNPCAKKIICLNTLEVFDTVIEAAKAKNIPKSRFHNHLHGFIKYIKIGDDYTTWEYYDENKKYVKLESAKEIEYTNTIIIDLFLCYENNKKYTSDEICEWFNIKKGTLYYKMREFNKIKSFEKKRCGFMKDGVLYHFKKIGTAKKFIVLKNKFYNKKHCPKQ